MRAICGGGRYDQLLAASGGPDLPALGFGDGRRGTQRPGAITRSDAAVRDLGRRLVWRRRRRGRTTDDRAVLAVTWLAGRLRAQGLAVEYSFRRQSLSRQLQLAVRHATRDSLSLCNQPNARRRHDDGHPQAISERANK